MRRVVDAMNVIGSRPDGWWRDRTGAIERFIAELDSWAAGVEEAVTAMLEHEPRRPLAAEHVEVAWAPRGGRNAADEEILRRLDAWLAAGPVTVVTSDRELARRARARGAEVEPAAAFRRNLGDS
jgi:predicted RNA-binding protein with PIN domain